MDERTEVQPLSVLFAETARAAGFDGTESEKTRQEILIENTNVQTGNLTGYDCPECKNRGWFLAFDEQGRRYIRRCKCVAIRRNLLRLEQSGLADLAERCRFDAWQAPEQWQKDVGNAAWLYARNPSGWFVLTGQPGSGKTHLCTAICMELIQKGYAVRYLPWREFSRSAKALATEDEQFRDAMEPVRTAQALYLDDFLKVGRGQRPTDADLNLAFEVINARYLDEKKLTILSSEWSLEKIVEMDEATGSRIAERAGANAYRMQGKNWRLKKAAE